MTKRSEDPAECPDDDNPRLTRIELRKARPAREVLPGLIGEAAAEELLGEEGRKGEWADCIRKGGQAHVQK
jgi:hypothetical protein